MNSPKFIKLKFTESEITFWYMTGSDFLEVKSLQEVNHFRSWTGSDLTSVSDFPSGHKRREFIK